MFQQYSQVIIAAAIFAVGYVIAYRHGRRKYALQRVPVLYNHKLTVIDSQVPEGCGYTIVLMRCQHCCLHVTSEYNGRWRTADFLKTRSEQAELEAMYGVLEK